MLNVCYECDGNFSSEIGKVEGYWCDLTLEFINLPKYKCNDCGVTYLDRDIAILTQEITRALSNINPKVKVVDVSDSYQELVHHLDEIYEMMVKERIELVYINNKLIINKKDVVSLFNDYDVLFAARNKDEMTEDVLKEIKRLRD